MDVGFRSIIALTIASAFVSACSPKTTTSVFPESANYASSRCTGQALTTRYVVQWEDGRFTVEKAANLESFKKEFLEPNLNQVRKVEYDRVVHFERKADSQFVSVNDSTVTTNDLDPNDYWGQNMVEAGNVWNQGVYGQNVIVGVVDSFVDTANAQLASQIAFNTAEIPNNGIDDDNNGLVDDYAGYTFISDPSNSTSVSSHGTHVSGIIAADPSKGYIKGMAPQAKIIPAPFIDSVRGGSIGDAILALQYVSARGAKVINASWGGAPCMDSLRNAFVELNNKGVLVVVAAGNDSTDIDYAPDYPAAFNMPNQLTVAASTAMDFMAYFSNSGFNLVHLAAPGNEILSTIPGNRIAELSGTSMAAPFVSGAAALLWSDRPQATVAQVRSALLQSVDITPNHEFKVQTMGRLNARKALEELRKMVP